MNNLKNRIMWFIIILMIFLLSSCDEESTEPINSDTDPLEEIILWEQTSWFPGEGVWALAINSEDHIFAGTAGEGLYRSTDRGNLWRYKGLKDEDSFWSTIVQPIAINSDGHIFTGSNDGIYRSIDNGDSWVLLAGTRISPNAIAFTTSGHIFAGGYNAFIHSTDGGDSWTTIRMDDPFIPIHSIFIDSNDVIYVGAREGRVFRSINEGEVWAEINLMIPDPDPGYEYLRSVLSLGINANGNILAGTNGSGLFRSDDIGIYANSWTEVDSSLTGSDIRGIVLNDEGHIFAATAGRGIFISKDDGDTWTIIGGGQNPKTGSVFSIAINSKGRVYAGTWRNGVLRTK